MLNKEIITDRFIGCNSDYKSADIALFGAGFDGTTSYRPGARFGGKVIRSESYGLETYSPYLDKELEDIKVFDAGEFELPFGNTEKVLDIIYDVQKHLLADNKTPIMLGGEHLITLPAIRAMLQKYPDLRVFHFDAHTDLRDEYLGEKLSHACVMRRCYEFLGDDKIYSFGIRSGTREEFEWAKGRVSINVGHDNLSLPDDVPIYVTIDLDILDPSEFPATGTPEAGGWRFNYLRSMLKEFCESYNIVGADMVEYSPPYDVSGTYAATAGKILRELMLSLN